MRLLARAAGGMMHDFRLYASLEAFLSEGVGADGLGFVFVPICAVVEDQEE